MWREEKEKVLDSAAKITEAVRKNECAYKGKLESEVPGEKLFARAFSQLKNEFDDENGGFGNAPKFPVSHRLLFLCDYVRSGGQTGVKAERVLEMVEKP